MPSSPAFVYLDRCKLDSNVLVWPQKPNNAPSSVVPEVPNGSHPRRPRPARNKIAADRLPLRQTLWRHLSEHSAPPHHPSPGGADVPKIHRQLELTGAQPHLRKATQELDISGRRKWLTPLSNKSSVGFRHGGGGEEGVWGGIQPTAISPAKGRLEQQSPSDRSSSRKGKLAVNSGPPEI